MNICFYQYINNYVYINNNNKNIPLYKYKINTRKMRGKYGFIMSNKRILLPYNQNMKGHS